MHSINVHVYIMHICFIHVDIEYVHGVYLYKNARTWALLKCPFILCFPLRLTLHLLVTVSSWDVGVDSIWMFFQGPFTVYRVVMQYQQQQH